MTRPAFFPVNWNGFSASNLFAAGLFCLFTAMFFGNKLIAAGEALIFFSLMVAVWEKGTRAFSWQLLRPSALWLALLTLVSVLSILANRDVIQDPVDHLGKLRHFFIVIAVLAIPGLIHENLKVKWRRDALVLAWLIPLLIAVIIGVIGWWQGSPLFREEDVVNIRRVSGFYGQVMTFAYSLQFSVIALAAFFVMPALWRKMTHIPWWSMAAALGVAAGGLYLTYTRGAMLGVVVGFVLYSVMRSKKFLLVLLCLGLFGGTVAYLDGARYLDTQSSIRVGQWKTAAMSFVERPLFGWGYRNFELHSAELKERYGFEKDLVRIRGKKPRLMYFQGHAHNNFLEAFASTGVIGGIAFLGFCYCWLREALRSRYALIFVPLIGAFLISGFFENTFTDSEVLNCILLIYLLTQWSLSHESDHSVDGAGLGLITTDT